MKPSKELQKATSASLLDRRQSGASNYQVVESSCLPVQTHLHASNLEPFSHVETIRSPLPSPCHFIRAKTLPAMFGKGRLKSVGRIALECILERNLARPAGW